MFVPTRAEPKARFRAMPSAAELGRSQVVDEAEERFAVELKLLIGEIGEIEIHSSVG